MLKTSKKNKTKQTSGRSSQILSYASLFVKLFVYEIKIVLTLLSIPFKIELSKIGTMFPMTISRIVQIFESLFRYFS